MTSLARPSLAGQSVTRIHAIGVGGMGLGPLAIYLAKCGWDVSGEDAAPSEAMAAQLQKAGVILTDGFALPADVDLVVFSSAVPIDHPTRVAAIERGVKTLRRGEILAELTRDRRLIAVAGSHGKTSVTAMLVSAARSAGIEVGYILGGLFANEGWAPADQGNGAWLIAEIDESDGTIEHFYPAITVVVNLDWDHADQYADVAALEATFAALLDRTTETVLSWDGCAITQRLVNQYSGDAETLTFGAVGDFRLDSRENNAGRQTLALGGKFLVSTAQLKAAGSFNALNATAALATLQVMGGEARTETLGAYSGVRRRQGVLKQTAELTVVEDYAHHPAEIRALLQSLREGLTEEQRLVVVFQPHRFSRTKQFKAEFAAALTIADSLHLLDVYGAGETFLAGGSTADLYGEFMQVAPQMAVNYLPGDDAGVLALLSQARRAGDYVVFVGAGDIENHARNWLAEMDQTLAQGSQWDDLAEELRSLLQSSTKVTREEKLANKTTLRVGGAARVYVEPSSLEELQATLRVVKQRGVELFLLGRGSNLLVPDAGVNGVVVSLRRPEWESFEVLADGQVKVGAGLRLKNLCGLAAKAGLVGFEFLEGIPGNVGGALRMNAGAMGGWMYDVVESIEVLALDGERSVIPRGELHVGYRHCVELSEMIAVGAVLKPQAVSESDQVGRQIDVYRSKRQESQPREPSAGCIFKNPPEDSAGRLIEICGLKGERIGDAEVSSVHGNFIINRGQATSAEVVELVRRVRAKVKKETGTDLEPEVLLYGGHWKELL